MSENGSLVAGPLVGHAALGFRVEGGLATLPMKTCATAPQLIAAPPPPDLLALPEMAFRAAPSDPGDSFG